MLALHLDDARQYGGHAKLCGIGRINTREKRTNQPVMSLLAEPPGEKITNRFVLWRFGANEGFPQYSRHAAETQWTERKLPKTVVHIDIARGVRIGRQ